MWRKLIRSIVALTLAMMTRESQSNNFSPPIDYPGATDTVVSGISDDGRLVGQFNVGDSTSGFLYHESIFTEIRYPDPEHSELSFPAPASDVNDSNQIVGSYNTPGATHGYVYSEGMFHTIDHPGPGSINTSLHGINNNGHIVGIYYMTGPEPGHRGTLYDGANFHPIDFPGAKDTFATGISNSGLLVGSYSNGTTVEMDGLTFIDEHGFLFDGTDYHPINFPGALRTIASGVNRQGWIVGTYIVPSGARGFLLRDGVYASIQYPGSNNTTNLYDINDSGVIVGTFQAPDGLGPHHGFTLTVPEPAFLQLYLLGVAIGLTLRRRECRR